MQEMASNKQQAIIAATTVQYRKQGWALSTSSWNGVAASV